MHRPTNRAWSAPSAIAGLTRRTHGPSTYGTANTSADTGPAGHTGAGSEPLAWEAVRGGGDESGERRLAPLIRVRFVELPMQGSAFGGLPERRADAQSGGAGVGGCVPRNSAASGLNSHGSQAAGDAP
jgi:hypothetical protein